MERVLDSVVAVNLTVSASPYSSGYVMGGLQTVNNAVPQATRRGDIVSASVFDKGAQGKSYELVFFSENPTASTTADGGYLSVHDNDIAKVCAVVPISDQSTYVASSISYVKNIAVHVHSSIAANNANNTLYYVLLAGETITPDEADLSVEFVVRGN